MSIVLSWILCSVLVAAVFAIVCYVGRPYWAWVAAT
jgi:hypothetical protein